MESRYFVLEPEGRLDYDEIKERDKRLWEETRRESELAFESFKVKAVVYAKELQEREERERLERIEKAKQKEIVRVEQLRKHNNYNDTFIDPITFEETPTVNGIILDTKLYSIATLRIWINQGFRFPCVPHSKRKLNDEEIELIGGIHEGPDSRLFPCYYDSDGYPFSDDSDYSDDSETEDTNPLQLSYIQDRTMTWDEFTTFIRTLPSFFTNNAIDSIIDESFVISGVSIVMTVRKYYQDTSGLPQQVFDIHLKMNDERFYERVQANGSEINVKFLRAIKRRLRV